MENWFFKKRPEMSFPYELYFPSEKQYLRLHKIRTDKDLAIIFLFWKTKKSMHLPEICIWGGFREHEKILFSASAHNVYRMFCSCSCFPFIFTRKNYSKYLTSFLFAEHNLNTANNNPIWKFWLRPCHRHKNLFNMWAQHCPANNFEPCWIKLIWLVSCRYLIAFSCLQLKIVLWT